MADSADASSEWTVALIGNPNTGKSTLFMALCGVRQRTGNYPGVTVEKKVGYTKVGDHRVCVIDLPGTYSLAPRSPDEAIAVDVLLGRQSGVPAPDAVLCIVDASNLERNLYLVSQLMELGKPVVLALNMMDVAENAGVRIDAATLAERLGVPVVPMMAHRRRGIEELRRALQRVIGSGEAPAVASPFPSVFTKCVDALCQRIEEAGGERPPRYLVERLLLDQGGYIEAGWEVAQQASVQQAVTAAREELAASGYPVPAVEAMSRYDWVGRVLDGLVQRQDHSGPSRSDRIDRVLTHRFAGTLVFAALMVVVFQAIFSWATPATDTIDNGVAGLGAWVGEVLPPGPFTSLLTDGVIAGVGAVLVFLPQIVLLFFFLAILEDCGYMARAAFLMDRLMAAVGLNGKAFIPLLSSFACAVPGIMATRVIENRRDRFTTILVAPLMSCSARLPVYSLLAAAFIPNTALLGGWLRLQGLTIAAMYFLGIIVALTAAWVFRRYLFPGETPPLVMELPPYKFPSVRVVVLRVVERGWAFIRRAGTIILAVTILVWAAASYPKSSEQVRAVRARFEPAVARLAAERATSGIAADRRAQIDSELAALKQRMEAEVAAEVMRGSVLGRLGHLIEPAVRPLGWDWRIGSAVIASFPAREVVIGAMGVIYRLGEGSEEDTSTLEQTLRQVTWEGSSRPVFTIPVALSLMVFFSLCAQCAATLAVIRREMNSWRWAAFAFTYMTALAYLAAWATHLTASFFLVA